MSLNGKTVFIVEDDLQNRVIYKTILVRHNVRIEFDRWGRDTLHRLKRLPQVDLIILDLMLPDGYSGYDIHDEIRRDPHFDDVPIVAISAADAVTALEATKARGFHGFIAKPIDVGMFHTQLENIIDGEKIWDGMRRY